MPRYAGILATMAIATPRPIKPSAMDDLLQKLDGPDQWWFAPLVWAGAYAAIVLVLAYYVVGV